MTWLFCCFFRTGELTHVLWPFFFLAALKCRQRKKAWLGELQKRVEFLTTENERLQGTIVSMRDEVTRLSAVVVAHRACGLGGVVVPGYGNAAGTTTNTNNNNNGASGSSSDQTPHHGVGVGGVAVASPGAGSDVSMRSPVASSRLAGRERERERQPSPISVAPVSVPVSVPPASASMVAAASPIPGAGGAGAGGGGYGY